MKKIFLFVLIVCICFALVACTARDPDNLLGTVTENEDIMYYTGAYQYGNMQNGSNFLLLDNEVVFKHYRYTKDGYAIFTRLFSYDLITGEVHSFCKDATCTHEVCAVSPIDGLQLEVFDGRLYGVDADWNLVMANEKGAEIIVDTPISHFIHHNDKLYVRTLDSSLVVFDNGKSEPQIVAEEYTGIDAVIFDNYLYAEQNLDIIRVNLATEEPKVEKIVSNAIGTTDGQYIYYTDLENYFLYRCNMDGSQPQLLLEQPVRSTTLTFDDEYFYYRLFTDQVLQGSPDSYDLYRFPKEDPTKIEKIATLPYSIFVVNTVPGTDKIFVSTYYEPGDEEVTYYVMGTDGSNPTKLEIPEY